MQAIIYFMEIKATFNLRQPKSEKPTNINLICRINGKQSKINIGTQFNIYPKHWDKKTQTAIVNNTLAEIFVEENTKINNRIKECKKLFDKWKEDIADNTNQIHNSETLLRKYINGEINSLETNPIEWFYHCIETISNAKESSKAQYKRDVKVFETFIKEKKIPLNSFSQFTYEILMQYQKYLSNESVATINNKINTLKVLLNHADNYSLIDLRKNRITNYKNLSNKIKDDNSIYLTEEEINKICNLKLTDDKKIVRDIFIVQYYLGQRISDIANLKDATIKENEIELYQKKTGTHVTIPLISPIVKDILIQYNYVFPANIVNNSTIMNRLIKEIAKEAGINEEVTYREQRGTTTETKKAEKWKLVTTHTARHSFVSNMLLKGYQREMIKRITGHKTDFAFQTYNDITSKDAAKFILEKENQRTHNEIKSPTIKKANVKVYERPESEAWNSLKSIDDYIFHNLYNLIIQNLGVGKTQTQYAERKRSFELASYFLQKINEFNNENELNDVLDKVFKRILELLYNPERISNDEIVTIIKSEF